jgi:hypothetical protein
MNINTKDEIGNKYGRLTVVEWYPEPRPGAYFKCLCDCGKEVIVRGQNLRIGGTKSCGCYKSDVKRTAGKKRIGELNYGWKGGKIKLARGYVGIKKIGHPLANNNGYVPEHRLVMEQKIGRPLLPNETVHHKNGIKDDNREDNLELWTNDHGYGSRIEDKINYALEIIKMYAPYYSITDTRK